ncbi:MAG: hypothetical protein FJY88_11720, partial [Candidatus Eisenbacteria bacterium]|nr:hypothetical protein [Candidatus Eisenbacteria bacterium]
MLSCRAFAALFVLASLSSVPAVGDPVRLVAGEAAEALPGIEVISSGREGCELRFTLAELGVEEVRVEGEEFQILTIPGGGLSGEIGAPGLPTFGRFVAVPDRGGVRVVVEVEEQEELAGYRPLPVQADEEGAPFAYDLGAYARGGYGDVLAAEAGEPAVLRDVRVVPLEFRPVQCDPVAGKLRVARRIRVSVEFEDSGSANEKVSSDRPIPPSFDSIYRRLIVNYPLLGEGGIEIEPGAWVLICPNDTQVTTRLQPLVDWRKRMGYPVTVATTVQTGTTNTAIKSWIQNAYNTWEIPPEHIVLAGDVTGSYVIPTWHETLSGYGGEGDHPYTQLDGADILPEVHIGRLSFSSLTELDVIVNKITGYESNPLVSDPNWFRGACLAGDPGQSGISVIQVQQWIKTRLRQLGYTQIDTVYSGDFVTQMRTSLNRGVGLFCYRGWLGMSGWSNSYTYQLTNGMKLHFAVIITCGTGGFDDTQCLSEGFLRAHSGGNPRGGIGAIGTATSGTHTRYNNCVTYGIFQGLLYEEQYTLGSALTRGKLELFLNYQAREPNTVTIWCHWNNLMGDPAVDCWTGFPETLTVTHPSSLPIGANSVTATVLKGGLPERDAKVCLLKGTETNVVGFTDANGEIELPVSAPTAGDMLITVTKHDRKPYLATIPVAATARFVGYQASTVDDDSGGGSAGNGDGLVNPGETIELRVQLRNFGSQNATGVTATLTSDDPYVTILDGQESFGDIPAGATAWSA